MTGESVTGRACDQPRPPGLNPWLPIFLNPSAIVTFLADPQMLPRRALIAAFLGLGGSTLGLAACAPVHMPTMPHMASGPHTDENFPNIGYATWANDEPRYRLYPGDELEVQVPSAPELTKTVVVQQDGRVSLPLLTSVMVADRSVDEAEAIIARAYSSQLLRPEVIINVRSAPLKVFVGGEVDKPGVYDMPGDINALQAVIMAGGFKTSAKQNQVVIIRRSSGGRAMMRTADLRRGIRDASDTDAVPLRRFDVVYVPRSNVAEVGLFVQQYIRDVSPIDLGFNYTFGPSAYVSAALVK
jgi:protein involved in polysaccharide export with SLBB domain